MKLPKVRELIEAIKALIKGPYTSDFPIKTHTPHPNFRGQPKLNQDICVGCLACVQVCPVEALDYKDNIENKTKAKNPTHLKATFRFYNIFLFSLKQKRF